MSTTEKKYSAQLSRCNFSSAYGVDQEIKSLMWVIKDFEAEAIAREKRERDNRIMRENAEKAERIVNEYDALKKIVSENPVFLDKFNAAMKPKTS